MESLTINEFLEKLKANDFKPSFVLKGLVKATEKDTEILFSQKQHVLKWVTIPISMIESVIVLKSLPNKDEPSAFVKLHLKSPSNLETKALYELFMSSKEDEMYDCKCGSKKELHYNLWQHPKFATSLSTEHYCPCCVNNCSCGFMKTKYSEHMGFHKKPECEIK